jgi:hypothetical protein
MIWAKYVCGEEFEVKRLHSRHRRFIAPGARWDLLFGVEVLWPEAEFRFDIVIQYQMDYLFGGDAALAGAIAAANAAAMAAQQANADAIAATNAQAAAAAGRSLPTPDEGWDSSKRHQISER